MTSHRYSTITLAALLSAPCAHPQSLDYAALEELFGEPVTTSVTGSPQRASEVPATMEIITADDIRRSGARDIPGVLRHVAGIDVLQWTNDHADVAVRGYNQAFSPRLLVLVDGRQVYADYYGFTPWSALPIELQAIRQIEVVKGPSSALFGFNAVGGVINIITFDPLRDTTTAVSTAVGTQGLAQGSAVTSLRLGEAAAMRISAGTRRSDDFSTAQLPVDIGTRRGNDRDALNVDAHFALSDNVELGVEATYSAAGQVEIPPLYYMSYTDYETRSLRTHWSADTRIGLIQANLYRNSIEADAFLSVDEAPFLTFDNDVTVAQLQDIFKVGTDHTLRVSAEYRHNEMQTTPITGGKVYFDVVSLGAMWTWTVNSALSLTNAVRVDDWSLGRSGFLPPEAGLFGLTDASWDRSLSKVSFNTGLVWETSDVSTVRFMVGRGQQLPNLLNLGGQVFEFFGFVFAGTPTLDPAVVTSYEIDWDRVLGESGTELRVGLFRGHTGDVLATFGNLGSSNITGLEVAISGAIGDAWRWRASYTPQRIRDTFADEVPFEMTLVDFENTTPRHVVNASLGWSRGAWEVDGYVRYQSDFAGIRIADPLTFVPTLQPVSSHASLDARLAYSFTERASLAIAGQNLTQPRQRQTSGPDVERRLLATFTIQF